MGMEYNLSQLFVVEVVGTAMLVFFGNGGVANALLPATKGHGIGHIGIAICFGVGVFLPIHIMGHISALFNPAVAIAVAITGEISAKEMVVAIAGEMVGGFLGAVFVWVTYFDHFQPLEALLPHEDAANANGVGPVLSSHVMLADEEGRPMGTRGSYGDFSETVFIKQELHPTARRFASAGNLLQRKKVSIRPGDSEFSLGGFLRKATGKSPPPQRVEEGANKYLPNVKSYKTLPHAPDTSLELRIAEDQEAKLVVFATRPGVVKHFYIFPLWAEFFGTFILTYTALAIGVQSKVFLTGDGRDLYKTGMEPVLVGFMLTGLVLALGGVTGPALNPARDLSPRIAHFLLPIPGKGSSEWWYSWVPVLGPIAGAIVGAQFNLAMKSLLRGGTPV
eukprot:TRINITY_DN526_c0_g2_i1.p1 TRINITY_DN526_c0_g2~~TRINITY_DN526_c0_g2_i1.p1  ORF type:complete len:392 (+),score=74.33 TRINITY_DN526_c0_g2_i1:253-1428(+)